MQRLNPNKGILVNKQTHRDIHKNNINNEEDLNKYIKERRERLDFVGFSRQKQIIYTLFIPLEDRIGIIKKVVIIQLVKK